HAQAGGQPGVVAQGDGQHLRVDGRGVDLPRMDQADGALVPAGLHHPAEVAVGNALPDEVVAGDAVAGVGAGLVVRPRAPARVGERGGGRGGGRGGEVAGRAPGRRGRGGGPAPAADARGGGPVGGRRRRNGTGGQRGRGQRRGRRRRNEPVARAAQQGGRQRLDRHTPLVAQLDVGQAAHEAHLRLVDQLVVRRAHEQLGGEAEPVAHPARD